MKLLPIGVNCQVLEDGTVIPNPGFEDVTMEDGEFRGKCTFQHLPARGTEPALIKAIKQKPRKLGAVAEETPIVLVPWIPILEGVEILNDMSESPFDLFSLPRDVISEFRASVQAEPAPAPWIDIVYGVGHTYYMELIINGALVHSEAVLAGGTVVDAGSTYYWTADPPGVPELVVKLYSTSGGVLLYTSTTNLRTLR